MSPNALDKNAKAEPMKDSFFLPDLRSVQSIFTVVVGTELLALVLVLASGPLWPFDWEELALHSLFMQWVALTCAAVLGRLRDRLLELSAPAAASASYAVVLIVTFFYSVTAQWLLSDPVELARGANAATIEIGKNMLMAAIIGLFFLRYFYVQEELNAKQRSELEHRLQALQSRIRPHFLFNSMNSIASLIETDPETAETVVLDLSHLFRASLNEVGNLVSFEQELDLCQRYMNIEGLRLGARLKVQWEINDNCRNVSIPLLTLQPLLENAVYHGIQPIAEGGFVKIQAELIGGRMELSVTNSYIAAEKKTKNAQGNRMALDNIRHRLSVLFGDDAILKLSPGATTYRVVLGFPAAPHRLM